MAQRSDNTALKTKLGKQFQAARDAQRTIQSDWDEHESLFLVRTAVGEVSTGQLSTQIIERSARVMAQLPSGKVQVLSKKDTGKNVLMNLVLQRYILPNANAQHDALTKLRMVNQYSHVYSYMPVLYDWDVRDDYIGPDFWIINPRNYFPQQGRISANDCDYVFVSTFMSIEDLKAKRKDEDWDAKAINDILEKTKNGAMPSARTEAERTSVAEGVRQDPLTDTDQIEVVTRYQRGKKGKWTSFAPDFDDCIIRNIDNQNPQGKIPVCVKLTNPLLDTFYNLSDTERSKYMQHAQDRSLNLKLKGEELRIFPPLKVNKTGVVNSTIRYKAGAKWLMDDINNGVGNHILPNPDNNFSTTFQVMQTGLINQFGSTTTEVSSEADLASFGKTPEALRQRAGKESTRDNLDRFYQEQFTQELFEGLINLLDKKGTKAFDFHIFDEEIAQIAGSHEDVLEVFDNIEGEDGKPDYSKAEAAKLTVDQKDFGTECGYKYYIDAGSTMQIDDAEEHSRLQEVMLSYMQAQPIFDQLLQAKGKKIEFDELFKRWLITGGTKDWDKILTDMPQEDIQALEQQKTMAQQQAINPQSPQEMQGQPPMASPEAVQQMPMGQIPQQPTQPQLPQDPLAMSPELMAALEEANQPLIQPNPVNDEQMRMLADQFLNGAAR